MPGRPDLARLRKKAFSVYKVYRESRPSFVAQYSKKEVMNMIIDYMIENGIDSIEG